MELREPAATVSPEALGPGFGAGDQEVTSRRSGSILGSCATLAVLAAALWLVIRLVGDMGWPEILSRLTGASAPWVALALLFKVAMFVAWGYRWTLSVQTLPGAPRKRVVYVAQVAGLLANLLAPFARVLGTLARVRYLRTFSHLPLSRCFGAVLFDQIAHGIAMAVVTVVAMMAAAALLGRPLLALALALFLVVVGVVVGVRRLTGRAPLTEVLAAFLASWAAENGGERRLFAGGGDAAEVVADLVRRERLWFGVITWGVGLFALNALSQWAVFAALGWAVSPQVVIIGVALGTAAGMLVGTPGGLGSTEAAMIGLYVALGVDPVLAGAGTLLFRALHYGVLLMTGVPALVGLEVGISYRRLQPEQQA